MRLGATTFKARYGPWALVTGAAAGLGAAFAERLAMGELNVALLDRDAENLAKQADDLRRRYPHVDIRECAVDLSDEAALAAALSTMADLEFGLLVANAADVKVGAWLDVSLDDKLRQIQVNCSAVAVLVDHLSRAMAARGHGGIIIMSSMAGLIGAPLVTTYAATKAFGLILAESLWAELGERGVDVLGVVPGMTRTPGLEASLRPGAKMPAGTRIAAPDEVVREALAAVGRRPSLIAGRRNRMASAIMHRLLPRRVAIGILHRSMHALYSNPPKNGAR